MSNKEIDGLIQDIQEASSQETVDLSLDSQSYIDDDQAEQICAAIKGNSRIKRMRVTNLHVSVNAAHTLLDTYLAHRKLDKLVLPLWSSINSPSQLPLMQMDEDFPNKIAAYNAECEQDQAAFDYFKKITRSTSKLAEIQELAKIPDNVVDDKIQAYLYRTKKSLEL